ncbi:MBL fold metallo-hydrolase [Oscillatoria sp. FACHB-1407]|uniref:MBL fold metallo-hydrolase n=1 Tax=Oscillatoria sp. FACHB-1407 TaxID=2692847 RepID=UPI002815FBF9|nr:MBL fold metallo-hydrolase [Oscillatoria sp. FACHB-1407]
MTELQCLSYGVGHTDEGVCLLMQMGPYRVMLDCGLENITPLIANSGGLPPADLVLCSHAHPDHSKGLLALHQAFPQMPIYASEVTAQLLPLNWLSEPTIPSFCRALPWRSPVAFQEGLSAELYPAGHLPGASAFVLTYTTPERAYRLLYTGDCFLSNSRLVEGFPLEELRGLKPDVLILEGSYGTARHPHRRQQENQLAERINRAIADQQSVLLPTPTLGLGQELLMLLRSHHHFTGRNIDIWVGGSVALGCDAYLELLPHFPSAVQNFARHQPLFWDDRIRPRVRRMPSHNAELDQIFDNPQIPQVILTDQVADLNHYCRLGHSSWVLLLPHQPGRVGAIETAVYNLLENSKPLQAKVQSGELIIDTYLLGDHCDGPGTTQLIHNLRPQHVVFIHGTSPYLTDLTSLEELQNRYQLHSPAAGTLVELPIGETFIQPAAPEARYEGELTELSNGVNIYLSSPITSDPRWQNFADTGLVEARWQGEELVLRGVPQREILNQGGELTTPLDTECCEYCLHYRGQRCWNQASPLFGFKVTPEGFCPGFEPLLEVNQVPVDDEDSDAAT